MSYASGDTVNSRYAYGLAALCGLAGLLAGLAVGVHRAAAPAGSSASLSLSRETATAPGHDVSAGTQRPGDRVSISREHPAERVRASESRPAEVGRAPANALSLRELEVALRGYDAYGGRYERRILELAKLADRVSLDDAVAFLAAAQKQRGYGAGFQFAQVLLARWAEKDPAAAMRYAEELPDRQRRDQLAQVVLDVWTRLDPAAAQSWVMALTPPRRKTLMGVFVTAVAQSDPERALAFTASLPEGELVLRRQMEATIVRTWAFRDGPSAMAWAEKERDTVQRRQLMQQALWPWSQTDPKAAADRLLAMPRAGDWASLAQSLAGAWADASPEDALAWAGALTDDRARNQALQALAQRIARDDVDRALQIADRIAPPTLQAQAIQSIISSIAYQDPEAAIRLAKALPSARQRAQVVDSIFWSINQVNADLALKMLDDFKSDIQPSRYANFLSSIVGARAEYDVSGALDLCQRLPAGDNRDQAVQSVLYRWARSSPAEAVAYAEQLPDGSGRTNALRNLASTWAGSDPVSAIEWAGRFAEQAYPSPFSQAIGAWAESDAKAAATYVSMLKPGTLQQQTAASVASVWARSDPTAALAWVDGFPQGESRSNALRNVVATWSGQDPDAAAEWVLRTPADASRDELLDSLASNQRYQDPKQAVRLGEQILDADRRNRSLQQSVSQWIRQDADAARAWVQRSSFPDETKRAFLSRGRE